MAQNVPMYSAMWEALVDGMNLGKIMGQQYRLPQVRVRVEIFPPLRNPYLWVRVRGFTGIFSASMSMSFTVLFLLLHRHYCLQILPNPGRVEFDCHQSQITRSS